MFNRCSECGTIEGYYDGMEYENEELKAEVERLRNAIRVIEEKTQNWSWGWEGDCGISNAISRIADIVIPEKERYLGTEEVK